MWSDWRCGRQCQFLHTTVESWSCVSVREVQVRLEGAEVECCPISRECAAERERACVFFFFFFMSVLMLNQVSEYIYKCSCICKWFRSPIVVQYKKFYIAVFLLECMFISEC